MKNLLLVLVAASAGACQTARPVADYERFYDRQPGTVLVLPVINETTSAEAPAAFSSTIASPLLRRGYSVLPVLPSADLLRAEGIYDGEQVSNESLDAFRELLGAEAVLQVVLHSWDTVYIILASAVEVDMTYTLFDTETKEVLWSDRATHTIQSDSGGGSLLAAAINAAVTAAAVQYVDLAREANVYALRSLPAGPYSPKFAEERTRYLELQARRDS